MMAMESFEILRCLSAPHEMSMALYSLLVIITNIQNLFPLQDAVFLLRV